MLKKVPFLLMLSASLIAFSAPLPCVRAKEAPKSVPLEAPFSYEGLTQKMHLDFRAIIGPVMMLIGQSLLATQRKLLPVFPAAKDCLSFISQDPASTLKKDSMQSLQIFEIEPKDLLSLLTCDRRAMAL